MSEIKEFNASELSDEELARVSGGFGNAHKARGYEYITGYQGNPEDLIGKTITFHFAVSVPSMGDWVVGGSAKVTAVGNTAGVSWIPSDMACVTTDGWELAQVVPLFAISSYN